MSIWDLAKPVIAQVHGYCLAGGKRARHRLRPRLHGRRRADGLPGRALRRARHALPPVVPRDAQGDGDVHDRQLGHRHRGGRARLGQRVVPGRPARERGARGGEPIAMLPLDAAAAQQARRAPPDGGHGHARRHPRRHRAVRARHAHRDDAQVRRAAITRRVSRRARRSATARSATTAPSTRAEETHRDGCCRSGPSEPL